MTSPPRINRLYIGMLLLVGVIPFYLNGWYNPHLLDNPRLFWFAEVVVWVALPLIILATACNERLFTLEDLGYHTNLRGRRMPITIVVLSVCAAALCVAIADPLWQTVESITPDKPWRITFRYAQMLPAFGWARLAAVVFMSISAGIVEEFYCRSMFRLLLPRGIVGSVAMVILSSLLFAGAHWEGGMPHMIYAGVWGVIFAVMYLLPNNLWPCIAAHTAVDLMLFTHS